MGIFMDRDGKKESRDPIDQRRIQIEHGKNPFLQCRFLKVKASAAGRIRLLTVDS